MNADDFYLNVHIDHMYLLLGAFVQFLLVLYLLGHPSNRSEKWALIRWLTNWAVYSTLFVMSDLVVLQEGIPDAANQVMATGQGGILRLLSFTVFAWIGYSGIDFFFRFLKREEVLVRKIVFVGASIATLLGWIFPTISNQSHNHNLVTIIIIVAIPYLYSLGLFIHKFFTSSDRETRTRVGLLLTSFVIGMFIF